MLFITMLTINPAQNREGFQAVRQIKAPTGISIKAQYGLFGGRDAVVVYDAPSSEAAMEFLTSTLCKITGVVDTETFAAVTLD